MQARSTVTVAAIHEAGIQVLMAVGYARFTTTRVAERAGVSVGSLYQYYPNKQALLAALVEEHLAATVSAVERACASARGLPLKQMTKRLVRAFLETKLTRVEASLSLYAAASQVESAPIVRAAGARGAVAVAGALSECPDADIASPLEAAATVSVALSALMQAALEESAGRPDPAKLELHMYSVAIGYLRALRDGTVRAKHFHAARLDAVNTQP